MAEESGMDWLVNWYARHCNGDWEHSFGIAIDTLDNPGWRLKIELTGTALETIAFDEIRHNYEDDASWWVCFRRDNTFHAACGALDLAAVIAIFKAWSEEN
ncbi:immunity 53 family protein [Mesorhizobium sp. BE184]|uniref:immunity 53 family protein n=1 Tax=Mesorhizobium sp. BE184 TaxID=2817714 RepID=UPI0028676E5F|nr:immunity 53 family protein [Mesorhizobium sp. BE184]MDR7033394.1 hypothetical protein [Mesorhizobium sp. BE184]